MESPEGNLRKSISRKGSVLGTDNGSASGKLARRQSFSLRASFSTSKYSKALEQVRTEQEASKYSFEESRIKLRKYMSTSTFGKYYENIMLALSVISTIEFIHQSYMDPNFSGDVHQLDVLYLMESVFIGFFLFDWALNLLLADNKFNYFFRYRIFSVRILW